MGDLILECVVWGGRGVREELSAKCTVLVIQLFLTNCIQAHDNLLEVLRHIKLYLSTRWPQKIGFPGSDFLKFCISMNSVFQDQEIFRKK